jgi:uncharacterized protein YcnI
VLVTVTAGSAFGHAVVYPGEAPTGAYQKYVLRVPNERSFTTTRVSITFPAGVRVISFDEVPGWALETTSADAGASFSGAAWTGELPVGRFVEFGFIGVNPSEATTLKWDVVQVYGDGTVVEWTGPADSATPASLTRVGAPSATPVGGPSSSGLATPLAVLALLLAFIALGVSLRPARAS